MKLARKLTGPTKLARKLFVPMYFARKLPYPIKSVREVIVALEDCPYPLRGEKTLGRKLMGEGNYIFY